MDCQISSLLFALLIALYPPQTIPTGSVEIPEWSATTYRIPDMQGEVRIIPVDADGDGDIDILIANGMPEDYDPSLMLMEQTAPGSFLGARAAPGRKLGSRHSYRYGQPDRNARF